MPYRILIMLGLALAAASPVSAQQGRPTGGPPIKVTLHPAQASVPALKHALLPRYPDLIKGNAAVYYGKVTAEQNHFFNNQEILRKFDHWEGEATLAELKTVDSSLIHGSIEHQLDLASRCTYCDWQLPIRQDKFYAILLPEVQQTRTFGRILATQMRIHVAKGEYDEALASARRGYALARNVAEGETLINGLVGMAIEAIISEKIHEMLQQPDAPNLYWALTELPDPMIDLRKAITVEMHGVGLSFPELRDVETAEYSPERWRELLENFWGELGMLSGDRDLPSDVQMMATIMRGYPMAKRKLIEQGMDQERVEAMPVAQVVLIYTMRTYRELRDDIFKWFHVPYHESMKGVAASEQKLKEAQAAQREIIPLASMLLPAIGAVRTAQVRMQQRIALLRVLEALRMHLAEEGRLPDSLDDIKVVPTPIDPVTNEPFSYRLEGEVAHLSAEPLSGWHAEYEIRVGKEEGKASPRFTNPLDALFQE